VCGKVNHMNREQDGLWTKFFERHGQVKSLFAFAVRIIVSGHWSTAIL
jgi:hypothetical protein